MPIPAWHRTRQFGLRDLLLTAESVQSHFRSLYKYLRPNLGNSSNTWNTLGRKKMTRGWGILHLGAYRWQLEGSPHPSCIRMGQMVSVSHYCTCHWWSLVWQNCLQMSAAWFLIYYSTFLPAFLPPIHLTSPEYAKHYLGTVRIQLRINIACYSQLGYNWKGKIRHSQTTITPRRLWWLSLMTDTGDLRGGNDHSWLGGLGNSCQRSSIWMGSWKADGLEADLPQKCVPPGQRHRGRGNFETFWV